MNSFTISLTRLFCQRDFFCVAASHMHMEIRSTANIHTRVYADKMSKEKKKMKRGGNKHFTQIVPL